jgi:hypothetical protein
MSRLDSEAVHAEIAHFGSARLRGTDGLPRAGLYSPGRDLFQDADLVVDPLLSAVPHHAV